MALTTRALLLSGFALASCRSAPAPLRPEASFLVVAGDSTFWVQTGGGEGADAARVRRSPLFLTEIGGRFYELFVADDDRSFYDAVVVGQRVYRRDLVSGDSVAVLQDTTLARIASRYAAEHPGERPLAPDEDGAEEPAIQATTETELVDVMGPYLSFERRVDIDVAGERDQHATRRGVLDVRDGSLVRIEQLTGEIGARAVLAQARRLFAAEVDSIRHASDERAQRAAAMLPGFVFDPGSFAIVNDGGAPAIAFVVPGRGAEAGGYALPLDPVRITAGPWWESIRMTLPHGAGSAQSWRGDRYDIVSREDSSGEWASLTLRTRREEWPVARLPTPVRRVWRLEQLAADSSILRSLTRAFEESVLYSGEARTALMSPDADESFARVNPASNRSRHTAP